MKANDALQRVRAILGGRGRDWIILAATVLLVLGSLAWVTERDGEVQWNYLNGFLITVFIYAVLSLGLSLEFGSTGLLNFGHVGFAAIGAYTYGVLMMRPNLRPRDAHDMVGAMWDVAPNFEGATAGGFITCLFIALVLGVVVAIPILIALGRLRVASRLSPRARLMMGAAVGIAAAAWAFARMFPLDTEGAQHAAAFLAMLVGVVLAAVAGILLGLPTVRLREDYLAIVTIGAAEIFRSMLLNEEEWTRGSRNIVNFTRPVVDWALESDGWRDFARGWDTPPASLAIMITAALCMLFFFLVLQALAKSPWGRVLRAIREDEEAAASLGKNVLWYKLQSLALGGAIAAVAGILLVTYLANISPTHFLPIVTFYAFIIVVLGGMGNHMGAIAGAFVLWWIFEISRNLPALEQLGITAGPPQGIFIGLLLVVIMMFRPQGLLGRKEELAFAK